MIIFFTVFLEKKKKNKLLKYQPRVVVMVPICHPALGGLRWEGSELEASLSYIGKLSPKENNTFIYMHINLLAKY